MLYEFHSKQNAKKQNSVHATYLITGKKRTQENTNGVNGREGDDTVMHSSPYMSSMPEPEKPAEDPVPRTTIVLTREEELESMGLSLRRYRKAKLTLGSKRQKRNLNKSRQYIYTAWSQDHLRYERKEKHRPGKDAKTGRT